jgi:hypothetical protein
MQDKKANGAKRLSLIEARKQIKANGINDLLEVSSVATPQQLQLLILFRMLHALLYEQAETNKDDDLKYRLNHQHAAFEYAQEVETLRIKAKLHQV